MLLLTLRDLSYRWLRFLLVTLLVSVVLALLFVMTGIAHRFEVEPRDSVDAIGASHWLIPAGSSGPFTATGTLPVELAGAVGGQPAVVGRATAVDEDGSQDEVVLVGVGVGALGSPRVAEGRQLAGPGEMVIDEASGFRVGDRLTVSGADVQVVGLTRNRTIFAGTPLGFLELGQAQQIAFGSTEVASALLLDGPLDAPPPGTKVLTADQVADDAFGPVENAVSSITLMVALLWLVAAIVIGAVVFLSALERQRDFAVLKAMGSRNRVLAGGLAVQAALVALVAALVAAGVQQLLHPVFPLGVQIPGSAFWRIPLIALVVALVAAQAGVRRVLRLDPAQAFGGPGA